MENRSPAVFSRQSGNNSSSIRGALLFISVLTSLACCSLAFAISMRYSKMLELLDHKKIDTACISKAIERDSAVVLPSFDLKYLPYCLKNSSGNAWSFVSPESCDIKKAQTEPHIIEKINCYDSEARENYTSCMALNYQTVAGDLRILLVIVTLILSILKTYTLYILLKNQNEFQYRIMLEDVRISESAAEADDIPNRRDLMDHSNPWFPLTLGLMIVLGNLAVITCIKSMFFPLDIAEAILPTCLLVEKSAFRNNLKIISGCTVVAHVFVLLIRNTRFVYDQDKCCTKPNIFLGVVKMFSLLYSLALFFCILLGFVFYIVDFSGEQTAFITTIQISHTIDVVIMGFLVLKSIRGQTI